MTKTTSLVFGVIFVLIGILGFFSNPIVGAGAYFETDLVHNIIHIILGIILLVTAKGPKAALTLKAIGILYIVLAILGILGIGEEKILGIAAYNSADNWLHLVVGIVLTAVGFAGSKSTSSATPAL